MRKHLVLGIAAAALLLAAPFTVAPAVAALSADVNLSVVNGDLQIVLTNTSPDDVLIPTQVLTAVFFDLAGSPTLSPISALLNGSTVYFGPNGGPTGVGGEWAYGTDVSAFGTTFGYGLSSAGLGIFGNSDFLVGSNLVDPVAVNGLGYGITSAGDNLLTGNKEVTGNVPLIKNSVTFLLSGLTDFTEVPDISNIRFVYGTSLSEQPVPEPGTFLLLGSGLIGFAGWGRKRFRK